MCGRSAAFLRDVRESGNSLSHSALLRLEEGDCCPEGQVFHGEHVAVSGQYDVSGRLRVLGEVRQGPLFGRREEVGDKTACVGIREDVGVQRASTQQNGDGIVAREVFLL